MEKFMNSQLLPVIVSASAVVVSALAVFVSAVMQNRTVRTLRFNTLASINASNRKEWIADLQKLIAEHLTAAYQVNFFSRVAINQQKQWPSDDREWELVTLEDSLFNGIRLRIDLNRDTHKKFYVALVALRGLESTAHWNESRDAIVELARKMFDTEWQDIMGARSKD
jgi:hypothetical protein